MAAIEDSTDDIDNLKLSELRALWKSLWHVEPPGYLRRRILSRSINYKILINKGGLSLEKVSCLADLVKQYKEDSYKLSSKFDDLYIGSRLVRKYGRKIHMVEVKDEGLSYNDELYSNLSDVAYKITGKKIDGYSFFGISKSKK